MSIADELQRIAEEARRVRDRLGELARACAELRGQLAGEPSPGDPLHGDDTTNPKQDTPRKLQSVS